MPGESLVQVTSGAGPKLHTWQRTVGANNVEDEVILIGEQHLATYSVGGAISTISTATAASHLMQLMAGASLRVYIRRIMIWQTGLATTAGFMQLGLFRLTSAGTGGTAVGANPLDTADAAAGATGMTLPTVKGTEGTALLQAWPYMMQTAAASSTQQGPIVDWDFDFMLRSKALAIPAGAANGIAIKAVAGMAGASVHIDVILGEASY